MRQRAQRGRRKKFFVRQFKPRLAQLFREISDQLGHRAEEVLHQAFSMIREQGKLPPWIISWTRQERLSEMDLNGIDYIFTTDVGDISVQIKSSRRAADMFEQIHAGQNILVIVINVGYPPETIYRQAYNRLKLFRRMRLQEARTAQK